MLRLKLQSSFKQYTITLFYSLNFFIMKRVIVISGLFLLSLALTGCQYFQKQPTTTEPVSKTSTATVTVSEGMDSADTTGTLTVEPAKESATTGTVKITEGAKMDSAAGTMLENSSDAMMVNSESAAAQ
jgi:hypothetical protein